MMGMDMMTLAKLLKGGAGSAQKMFGGMPDYISQMNKPQGGGGAPVDPNGMFAQIGGDGPKDLRRPAAPQPVEPEKVPWMQQKALGGFERGDLLLAGMGMLGGKNFKEGLGNASGVAYDAFGRQREEGEKRKQSEALVKAMVAKGVPVEEATAMAEFGPGIAFNDVYNTQAKDWREQRTAIEDDRYEAQWLRDEGRYESEQERLLRLEEYGIARDEILDGRYGDETAESRRRFGLTYGLDKQRTDAATAPDTGPRKPLIGAEAMARVATGLPNAKRSINDLNDLVFGAEGDKPTGWGGFQMPSSKGYDPASDWGAAIIEAIPDFGALKGAARFVGGEDYRMFKDSYGAFEAAMLPIISGAAITESEGKRQMQALQIKPGDKEVDRVRKLELMEQMVGGVEMAARGDMEGFLALMDAVGAKSGAGPVQRGPVLDPETEELVKFYSTSGFK